jgi:Kef-type K+ transport system membrane component KefB
MTRARPPLDPLTQASVTIAWVICGNKPFYPLYVWYLVGDGVTASLGTLLAAPLFLAIPLIARRAPTAARIALPLVGTLDTLFATKLFGTGSGTELFLAPCIMLVALSFRAEEAWWQRGLAAFVFLAFVFSRYAIGPSLHVWKDVDLSTLLNLNAFAVASLMAFVAIRYSGILHITEAGARDRL